MVLPWFVSLSVQLEMDPTSIFSHAHTEGKGTANCIYSWALMTCCAAVKHSGRSYSKVNANRGRLKVVPVLAMHLEMVVLNYPLV